MTRYCSKLFIGPDDRRDGTGRSTGRSTRKVGRSPHSMVICAAWSGDEGLHCVELLPAPSLAVPRVALPVICVCGEIGNRVPGTNKSERGVCKKRLFFDEIPCNG